MNLFKGKNNFVVALIIFLIGIGVVCVNYSIKKEATSETNVQDTYNQIVKEGCYLDDWLVQTIQIGVDARQTPTISSDLDLAKYSAGLRVRVYKRLISVDGKRYSENVPTDTKFAMFDKVNYFTYKCDKNKTIKSKLGFFDRTKGVPQK